MVRSGISGSKMSIKGIERCHLATGKRYKRTDQIHDEENDHCGDPRLGGGRYGDPIVAPRNGRARKWLGGTAI